MRVDDTQCSYIQNRILDSDFRFRSSHLQPIEMDQNAALVRTDLSRYLPKIASGKVRDIYAIDESTLLFVTTDRISAYDVVMKDVIVHDATVLFRNPVLITTRVPDRAYQRKVLC